MLIFFDLQLLGCLTSDHTRLSLSFVAFLRRLLAIEGEGCHARSETALRRQGIPNEPGQPQRRLWRQRRWAHPGGAWWS